MTNWYVQIFAPLELIVWAQLNTFWWEEVETEHLCT